MEQVTPRKKAKLTEALEENSTPEQEEKLAEKKKGGSLHADKISCEAPTSKNTLKRIQTGDAKDEAVALKKIKLDTSQQSKNDSSNSETENPEDSQKEKKRPYHQRKKHTLNCVLQQMEFYFGDSSLSKDRFLKSLVDTSPDGYVDLSIFGNFNKLQTLHRDGISRNVLIQALSQSTMLQLNEDKTRVRRITPFKEISQDETDKRTIYVEHLPSHATHMWVRQVFSQCGKVEYVSLPTYKTSKQIKGFAFVEFARPEEAERACSMLNNPLPDKEMERPGKFPKTNKTLDRLQKLAPSVPSPANSKENNEVKKTQDESIASTEKDLKKKKKKKAKKRKAEDIAAPTGISSDQKSEGKKKKKKKKQKANPSQEQGVDEGGSALSQGDDESSNLEEMKPLVGDQQCPSDKTSKTTAEDDKAREEEAVDTDSSSQLKKKKKKKRKNKRDGAIPPEGKDNTGDTMKDLVTQRRGSTSQKSADNSASSAPKGKPVDTIDQSASKKKAVESAMAHPPGKKLSHKERKLLRQEDIRRKRQLKQQGLLEEENQSVTKAETTNPEPPLPESISIELDGAQPTSILKLKKAAEKKRVEFDPVPITTEFVAAKGARKRKKQKREKPHLRVITKHEWLSLKNEYIEQQKSHMKALKESLRELKQQENKLAGRSRYQKVDLEDVFGTKPLKLSHEVKMASIEKMKFTPNVIVQWWCSHEMHRDKIRTMFKESHASNIAYIDANEEARSGYIRFKDEASAEEFTKMSRSSTSFMARVLPVDQQEEYWEKANTDRMNKLGRKKKEQGCDRIARKMFQRNKATFFNKPSRIVFDEVEKSSDNESEKNNVGEKASSRPSPKKTSGDK